MIPSGRPFWKRKRWIVTGLFWLLLIYVTSVGPAAYVRQRDWLNPSLQSATDWFYKPLTYVVSHEYPLSGLLMNYSIWWQELGQQHAEQP